MLEHELSEKGDEDQNPEHEGDQRDDHADHGDDGLGDQTGQDQCGQQVLGLDRLGLLNLCQETHYSGHEVFPVLL